jgi:hypothetical protein
MPRSQQLLLVAAFWLAFAAPALWFGHVALDTDGAMRLAQVRDLLAGQSWFDTTQYRMNTPFGLPMHWSRLVDLPIAALILLSGSEQFALKVWPLIVLFAVLAALARTANALGGQIAAITVLVLGLFAAQLNGLFAAGNIDHHNVQIALMLWTLAFLVEQRARAAAITIALGLAIGLESLPYCAVACAIAALWLRDAPARARAFGLTLAIASTTLLLTATATRFRFAPACDTYSLFYAVLVAAGGAGLAAISYLPRHRLPAVAGLALVLAAMAALLNPACLSGPYGGMSAELKSIWLTRINEARPAFVFAFFAPSEFVGAYVYACFALAACLFAPGARHHWPVIALSATALLVATLQIRAVPFATLFALPGLAAALSRLKIVPLVFGLLLGSDITFALAGDFIEGSSHDKRIAAYTSQVGCADEASLAPLRSLPRGRVAAFVDQGPAVLAYTDHAAIAGPYHRNASGILESYAIFTGKNPRALLTARGIDYVMTCSGSPDWDFYRTRGGLIAALAVRHVPSWLVPVGRKGEVAIYRVSKDPNFSP